MLMILSPLCVLSKLTHSPLLQHGQDFLSVTFWCRFIMNWFNAECQMKRYLCCHHVLLLLLLLLLMLSKFFGGKFKYLNRKNSEFLAGNSNANAKCKMQMQMQMQNANAKCKMQIANANANAKCKM